MLKNDYKLNYKRSRKNFSTSSHGFTLIEILAVIIILGIIALVVVPVTSKYILKTRKTVYEEHELSLEEAAKNMTTECLLENKTSCKIPVGNGSRRVFLSELIEDGYIDELKDPRSDSYCDEDLSFVVINKTGSSEFDYKVCLKCEEYTTDLEMCKGIDSNLPICGPITTGTNTWTNDGQTITVECIDNKVGCSKRRFTKVFTNDTEEKIIKIQDNEGKEVSCDVSGVFLLDTEKPTCTLKADGEVYEDGIYYGKLKVKLDTYNDNGSKSGIEAYGIGITERVMYDNNSIVEIPFGITEVKGYVKDKAGNEGICTLQVNRNRDFDLTYDDNTGTGCSTKSQKVVYKHPYNEYENLCTPTKTGYTFNGWYTEKDGGEKQENETLMPNKEDTTLYAHWTANNYVIAFNGNGNTGGSTNSKTCTYDEGCALTSNGFVKTGYIFLGWARSSDGEVVYNNGETVNNLATTGTITLYAKWKANTYTVTYNGNGATGGSTASQTCTIDTNCVLTNNGFSRTGHTFAGWATTSGGGVSYGNGATVKNIASGGGVATLYAKWTIHSNTLTVNPNSGTVSFNGANRTSSTSVTQNYNTTIAYGKPTRGNSTASAGSYTVSYAANGGSSTPSTQSASRTTTTTYTFSSWGKSGTCGNLSSTNNSGTYTYPANSGTTCTMTANYSTSSNTITAQVTLASAIARGGYNFAGWKSSTNNTTYSAGTKYTPTANTTMTAQWTPVNYTITYNLNSGSISGQKTSYNIETATFTLPTPVRGSCTFTGWTGSNGGSPQTSVTISKGSTGNRSYTANWDCRQWYFQYEHYYGFDCANPNWSDCRNKCSGHGPGTGWSCWYSNQYPPTAENLYDGGYGYCWCKR